jgi:hypothetical protein
MRKRRNQGFHQSTWLIGNQVVVEIAMAILVYFGGFLLAIVCACFALRKRTKRKTALLLSIAAVLLVVAQIALWQVIVASGNAM